MKRPNLLVAKNSLANVVRSSASGILALLLPPFLTSALGRDRFAAWALVLQFAAYINLLDFGLQTAVGRYVAKTFAEDDVAQCNRIVTTAFVMLTAAAGAAYLILLLAVAFLPGLSRAVPPALLVEMRSSILILAAFYAVSLPLSTFTGVLVGVQRNELIALTLGGTKLLGGVAIIVVARHWQSLPLLGVVLGASQLLGALLQYGVVRGLFPQIRMSRPSRECARELIHYCAFLTLWLVGGFLFNGLDLLFVGHFDFRATGAYAIATSLMNVVQTLNGAIFGAMLPAISVLHARHEFRRIGVAVVNATRYGIYVLVLAVLPFFLIGKQLMRLWIGAQYAAMVLPILLVLLVATILRFASNPYTTAMLGTGQHRQNTVGPFVEGIVNVVFSILLGIRFGAIGVAYGTLLGSAAGLACHIFYNVPRTREIEMSIREYGVSGVMSPLLRLVPLGCVALLPLCHAYGMATIVCVLLGIAGVAWSAVLVVRLEGWQGLVGRAFGRPLPLLK